METTNILLHQLMFDADEIAAASNSSSNPKPEAQANMESISLKRTFPEPGNTIPIPGMENLFQINLPGPPTNLDNFKQMDPATGQSHDLAFEGLKLGLNLSRVCETAA